MKRSRIINLAYKLNPAIADEENDLQRLFSIANVLGTLATIPLLLIGLYWQITRTNWSLITAHWWLIPIIWVAYLLFSNLKFRIQLGVMNGSLIYSEGTIIPLVSSASSLLFGPTILWFDGLISIIFWIISSRGLKSPDAIWNQIRNNVQGLVILFFGGNLSLLVYERLNGRYPISGFNSTSMIAAFASTSLLILVLFIIMYGFFMLIAWINTQLGDKRVIFDKNYHRNGIMGIVVLSSISFFGILMAGLYSTLGTWVMVFFLIMVLCAALLANQLSRANARMEQRSRELGVLEKMSQKILNSPLDLDILPDLLQEFLPNMFPGVRLRLWLLPDNVLYERSFSPLPEITAVSHLLTPTNPEPTPLTGHIPERSAISNGKQVGAILPIVSEQQELLGGILFVVTGDQFKAPSTDEYFPSMQALAGQIAAAVQRVKVYEQSLASEKMARELEIAGQIQNTFLPGEVPQIDGWQLTATIEPARQTSGDFYDFVDLGNGRLAIIVADVADKGTGAALYMALSRTLIRTYALEFPEEPEKALQIANERILSDTKSDQFVTVFFGILDSHSSELVYANAGHNPAFLFSANGAPQALSHTGIPLGMFEGMAWKRNSVAIAPDDVLVVYTDGVTEAQNEAEDEFGEARLIEVVEAEKQNGRSASDIERAILTAVHHFVADAPQFDDITLLVATAQ